MNIINNIISLLIKRRLKSIELSINSSINCQQKILMNHIKFSRNTMFGEKYKFQKIFNYDDFNSRLPIFNYDDLSKYINLSITKKDILWPGRPKWFAKSSGTSNNKSKYIPVTMESLKNCHFKAGKDMLSLYLKNNSKTKILNSKSLMIGGSTNFEDLKYSYAGDLSAIIIKNLPFWVQQKRLPSMKTAIMEDWEEKVKNISNEVINSDISSISGVPSWTIKIISEVLKQNKIEKINDLWPNLELYMHGGTCFKNYKNTFNEFLSKKINFMEIYNASEGFFALQNDLHKNDLLLLTNHGIFYEFAPITNGIADKNNIVDLKSVELNKNYSLILTTNGGLWRYEIGDTVYFTSLNPFKIVISGRTKCFINAFGEELSVENSDDAINYACIKTNSSVNEYIASPLFYNDKTGCHEWIIEFEKHPRDLVEFSHLIDLKLKSINSDYESKRFKNILLKKPIIRSAPKNFFFKILKEQNKLGGQNKIKRLHNERNFIDFLLKKL